MIPTLREKVVDLLVERHHVDRKRLETLLASPQAREKGVVRLLSEEGLVGEKEILASLSEGMGLPPMQLSRYQIDPSLADFVPEQMARRHHLVPVSKIGEQLSIAMADPLDVVGLDDLALMTSLEIRPILAAPAEIEGAIRKLYAQPAAKLENILQEARDEKHPEEEGGEEEEEVMDLTPLGMAGQRAPIVRVVDLMLMDALRSRASDIHVEPYEAEVRIRYRIDGALFESFRLPRKNHNALTTRLKIMARLDITENRLPQDGRFKIRVEGREVDFRVSALPISFGNKMVLRILDRANLSAGLAQMGFLPSSLEAFRKAVSRPYGMILVTGPTGSGKSTTLYSVLSEMNDPGRNILTVEDPVEYQLDGVTQVQVHPEIGLTFANTLRAFLRQAPDLVLVGEIRDAETADIAIKASLTGQIVLSTLHTNDAVSAISRLVDMGVDPFLLASSLVFVAAQRLCRQLCVRCRVPDPEGLAKIRTSGVSVPEGTVLYRGKGCPHCRGTGFRGRFAILEALLLDDPLREMIITRHASAEMKAYGASHGMKTLRQEGLEHCLAGRTSLDEVLRVTVEE